MDFWRLLTALGLVLAPLSARSLTIVFQGTVSSVGIEQHVVLLNHTVALFELGRKKSPDAGFAEHAAAALFDEQGAAGEIDAIVRVGRAEALPERTWGVAKHGTAVEFLAVAEERGQFCAVCHRVEIRERGARHNHNFYNWAVLCSCAASWRVTGPHWA